MSSASLKSTQAVDIYGLIDPITGKLMYIGKANDSIKRLKSHLRDSKSRNTPVYLWIRELSKKGLIPVVTVLEKTLNWKTRESEIIEHYKQLGNSLLNLAKGGGEPFCSKEQRQLNGANNARKIHSNPVSKRTWELKHKLALTLRWLESHGRAGKATEIRFRLTEKGVYFG